MRVAHAARRARASRRAATTSGAAAASSGAAAGLEPAAAATVMLSTAVCGGGRCVSSVRASASKASTSWNTLVALPAPPRTNESPYIDRREQVGGRQRGRGSRRLLLQVVRLGAVPVDLLLQQIAQVFPRLHHAAAEHGRLLTCSVWLNALPLTWQRQYLVRPVLVDHVVNVAQQRFQLGHLVVGLDIGATPRTVVLHIRPR